MLQRFLGGYVVGHAAHLAGTYLQRVDPLFVDLDRGLETNNWKSNITKTDSSIFNKLENSKKTEL